MSVTSHMTTTKDEVIQVEFGELTAEHIRLFASATTSTHYSTASSSTVPLTFPTFLRGTEFRWLDRLAVNMQDLLHTEQEYEYYHPLKEGDRPIVATRMVEYKSRRGLLLVTLESEIRSSGVLQVKARSAFVVRLTEGGN